MEANSLSKTLLKGRNEATRLSLYMAGITLIMYGWIGGMDEVRELFVERFPLPFVILFFLMFAMRFLSGTAVRRILIHKKHAGLTGTLMILGAIFITASLCNILMALDSLHFRGELFYDKLFYEGWGNILTGLLIGFLPAWILGVDFGNYVKGIKPSLSSAPSFSP